MKGGEMYWDAFKSFLAGAISISNNNDIVHVDVAASSSEVNDISKKEL
jgi:hypothetical protein